MDRILEICCYSAESAFKAEQAGADRIELCDNFNEGGTTPSYATIKYVVENLNIPVNVIIRPRGGDFLYSRSEFEIMKTDVLVAKALGAHGVVFGILNYRGEIDLTRTKEILDIADTMDSTFHRAFDMCQNQLKALDQLKSLGVKRVLTSGGKATAIKGIAMISELERLAGNDIIVMPGGGINENSLIEILQNADVKEVHASAITFENSEMTFKNPNLTMGKNNTNNEYQMVSVDSIIIRKMKEMLRQRIF